VKVVLDTNVFVSGIFFTGPPHRILEAWGRGELQLLVSEAILDEYRRVGIELAQGFPGVDLDPILRLVTLHSTVVQGVGLPPSLVNDPSDLKFLECAASGGADCLVSGDKHLLRLREFRGVEILKPRDFLVKYLSE
jgi:putative PIN family toxin of toxin-antitoxin system